MGKRLWFDVPVGLSNPGAPRLALSRSSAMAWCLAILLLLALLAPGALQEAAWRPLTALLPQLATLALPFMATSLVSLLDTLSHSLCHRRRRRRRPRSPPSCFVCSTLSKTFFFSFALRSSEILSCAQIFILSRRVHYTREKWIQIDRILVFFLDLDLDVLAADLAKRFFENGPRNSIDDDETRVADVDKERVRLGGGEGAGREGPRMQRTNFRPRSDEVKQYRTWVTQKGVGAFVHSPREGRGAHFFSSKYKIR